MFSLIGLVFGGLLRLAPEVLKLFTAKADRDHEFRMANLNIEGQMKLAGVKMEGAAQEAQSAYDLKGLEAMVEATKAQATPTGIKWVDALSATVRPFLTYWWMSLYTAVKIALLVTIFGEGTDWAHAILQIWNDPDMSVLSSIISFWFLDRHYLKKEGAKAA